ncbi:bidirectional sugar transporter N3-like [Impatiens glandulifera]|uniref:bidirectional sugar transporter N3-like n=1 Tax=Impatiens glandulifera TaxID=253017 RepID=UPI001FB0F1E5|nr:bidirectional sugar transporter N3-like [Impatiens glandulifera]
MALASHPLAFAFGIIGNIISVMVFLSPINRKSTQGFQVAPYVVGLISAMLILYYAWLKVDDVILLITINAFGCLVESIYIGIYIFYAPRKVTSVGCVIGTLRGFWVIVMLTQVLKQVIQTGSVEFMPLTLTLTLTSMIVYWIYRSVSSNNATAAGGVGSVNLPVVVGDNIEELV